MEGADGHLLGREPPREREREEQVEQLVCAYASAPTNCCRDSSSKGSRFHIWKAAEPTLITRDGAFARRAADRW